MSSKLKVHFESLWSEAMCFAQAHHPEKSEAVLAEKRKYTFKKENIKTEFYSGYLERTLEKFGLSESTELAEQLRNEFQTLLVLGIGGSALGARTALNALDWSVPKDKRKKVLIIDNLDPVFFEQNLEDCELNSTAVLVISKSGGTIETMAQCSALLERFSLAGLDFRKHFFAVTDPSTGALRKWCDTYGIKALSVPSDVGGRFSVLTPVGLLPLAFSGINVTELVEGAVDFLSYKHLDPLQIARAGLRFAELEKGGFFLHTLMPYATKLKDFGGWFVQLWGESLGKTVSGVGEFGTAPLAAVGATDQHSLLQFLVEGPNRGITGFLRIENWPQITAKKTVMSKLPAEFSNLSFAFGKSFDEILNAEALATRQVLVSLHRPTYEIIASELSPFTLGALFALYMELVSFTGAAHKINPYDQPGVELGKIILPKLLLEGRL